MKIKLYNRDNAEMYFEKVCDTEDKGVSMWKLRVDPDHDYCMKYMRMGGDFDVLENNKIYWKEIKMIDPAGGPYLELGDELDNKYKIIKFIDESTVLLSERDNYNKEHLK